MGVGAQKASTLSNVFVYGFSVRTVGVVHARAGNPVRAAYSR